MTNKYNTVLYIGVTGNLHRRLLEHKNKLIKGFTSKYNIYKLLYYESTTEVWSALEREKQIKRWSRKKKIELIKTTNPTLKNIGSEI